MALFGPTVYILILFISVCSTEPQPTTISGSEMNSVCSELNEQDIKISIFSRRNKTGRLYAQVKFEDESTKRNSWQMEVDHDSACESSQNSSNEENDDVFRVPRSGSTSSSRRAEIGKKNPPKYFYELVPGFGYYKYHNRGRNWYEAKQICEKEGAHLAIPNSREEVEILMELFYRTPILSRTTNFIGITDSVQDGTWMTVFGEPLNRTGFAEWGQGQPDGGISKNCGGLYAENGKLYAESCTTELGFYCELEF